MFTIENFGVKIFIVDHFYTVVIIICVLSMIFLAIDVGKNTILPKNDIKWFKASFIFAAIGAVCEYLGVLFVKTDINISWLHKMITFTEFSISPYLGVLLARSCGMKRSIRLMFIVMSVNMLLEAYSIRFGFIFYIDENGVFNHGNFYWIYLFFCGLSFAYILFVFVIIAIRAKLHNSFSLILITLVNIIGQTATAINGEIYSGYLAISITAILLYIFIQNMLRHVMLETITVEKDISNHDALTRVLSRISYDNQITQLDRNIRDTPDAIRFAVCECDLNNLKIINDSFGHDKGDEYIINCCKTICNIFKHSPVYRIGGDEFVAILNSDDYDNLERIKLIVDDLTKSEMLKPCTLAEKKSFAAGFAVYDSTIDKCFNDVIKRADTEMYENKKMLKSL